MFKQIIQQHKLKQQTLFDTRNLNNPFSDETKYLPDKHNLKSTK